MGTVRVERCPDCKAMIGEGMLYFHQRYNCMSRSPKSVTRFEVIDASGRVLTRHDIVAELSYQDDGRTLKVFLTDRGNTDASAQHKRELSTDLGTLRTQVGSHGNQSVSEASGSAQSAAQESSSHSDSEPPQEPT